MIPNEIPHVYRGKSEIVAVQDRKKFSMQNAATEENVTLVAMQLEGEAIQ